MGASYRLFGAETSPFSIKVRSYLRYKKLPFEWVARGFGSDDEFRGLAQSEALPMLVSPKGGIAHDSSLILSRLEAANKKPPATPGDPACRALSALIEDYADEWLNKAMFQYRWGTAKAAKAAAERQVNEFFAGYDLEGRKDVEKSTAKAMTGRLKVIGISKKTVPVIEASFERFLEKLNAHLEHHLFLFGGHPSLGDFALAGQLIQLASDERSRALIQDKAPFVAAWCEFMEDPRPGADFDDFASVKETLLPLFRDEIMPTYVRFAEANAAAIAKKRKTVTFDTLDGEFKQSVQHHTLRSWEAVKAVFADTRETEDLKAFLEAAGLGDILALKAADTQDKSESSETKPKTPAEESSSEAGVADTSAAPEETAVVPDKPEGDSIATPSDSVSAPASTTDDTSASEDDDTKS